MGMEERQQEAGPAAGRLVGDQRRRAAGISVRIHASAELACQAVAEEVLELVARKPSAALGLATGSTMVGVYAAMVEALRDRPGALDAVRTFNLDEYLDLPPGSPSSFRAFMDAHLFGPCGLSEHQVSFPCPPSSPALTSAAEPIGREFEAAIERAGGLDLQLLGLGRNGHIAFNEPGSGMDSRTREVELAPKTRADAAATFGSLEAVPCRAVTMGVGTILEARQIRVLALGAHKADVVASLLAGASGLGLPAAYLAGHADVCLHLDAAAGSRLSAG